MNAVSDALSLEEKRQLAQAESLILNKLQLFLEVGQALMQIKHQQLYRATHSSFEKYCRDRLKMTAGHANRLLTAREVYENVLEVTPVGVVPVERQLRLLAPVPPEKRRSIWAAAIEKAAGSPLRQHLVEALADAGESQEKAVKTAPIDKIDKLLPQLNADELDEVIQRCQSRLDGEE